MLRIATVAIGVNARSLMPLKHVEEGLTRLRSVSARDAIRRQHINPDGMVYDLDPATLNFRAHGRCAKRTQRLHLEAGP